MADVPGLEPRTTESKSVVLPLHHTPINFGTLAQTRTERTLPFERSDFANLSTRAVNALVGMRILNCTVCGITAQVNSVHFNITDFFIYKKISHPRYRPFAPCLKCRAQSSLLGYFTLFFLRHKTKNPRVFSPRVLGCRVCYFVILGLLGPRPRDHNSSQSQTTRRGRCPDLVSVI